MQIIAKIAVENTAYGFDKEYSYLLPERLRTARAGCRVRVPFGRGNQSRTGLILSLEDTIPPDGRLKPVEKLLDETPVLEEEGLVLLRYLRERTFCTWFDALRVLIPAGIGVKPMRMVELGGEPPTLSEESQRLVAYLRKKKKPVAEKTLLSALDLTESELAGLEAAGIVRCTELLRQRIRDEKVVMVRLVEDAPTTGLSKRQKEAVAFLAENGTASLREITYYCAMTRGVVDALRDRGVVEYYDEPRFRNPYGEGEREMLPPPALSDEQTAALERLAAMTGEAKPKPALLYGVTGSGKTEVFLALIQQVLEAGRTVIVLVPEIGLTAQTVRTFHSRFGRRVAVLHSGLSLGERLDEWRRIREGDADIVVGTRSAVFAPLRNIGLIVMDEEQEHTYHAEKSPRFHARDVARFRCEVHGGLLLLASATPSVESYYHARQGRYQLVTLHNRFGAAELPDVYLVDMRDAENLTASAAFSERLLQELHYNLAHGEQSILLLNRRGYSTLIRCSSCGAVEECPHCSVSLTFHRANDAMVCHYCGFTGRKPRTCAVCGSEMVRFSGMGTQRLQEELATLYPEARILRVDMDTTLSKFSHDKLFQEFLQGKYDIMIGTQMVAKGLNFPAVTLVGVLAADQSLYAMDFRGFERSFALLTQVVGRSGRHAQKGRALIQTYHPDHPVIAQAAEQDYPAFFAQEIGSRKLHLYPPFCTLAGVGFVGLSLEEVTTWSERFLEQFRLCAAAYPGLPIRVLGPVDADTLKAAGKYRRKLIIKCKNNRDTRALLREVLIWFSGECKTVTAFVDMYYDRM